MCRKGTVNIVLISLALSFFCTGCAVQQVPPSVHEQVVGAEEAERKMTEAEAYAKRGHVYASKGQYDQAIADYTKSLSE